MVFGFECFKCIFFKHSKLTGLYTGRMTMLMKARLYKTTLWLKVIESHNVLE